MHSGNSTGATSRSQPAAEGHEVPGERPLFSAGTYELLALLIATIGTLGVCNNLLVLVLYYKFKRLRTPTNLFLVNISLSDLLVSVCGVSLTFMSCLRSRWVWDAAGCVWDGFSNSLFGGCRRSRPSDPLWAWVPSRSLPPSRGSRWLRPRREELPPGGRRETPSARGAGGRARAELVSNWFLSGREETCGERRGRG